jgi:tRNA-uridine 2-sulfurtransferase
MSVVVGLSGGVDSAVAAMLLRDAGHRVRGATLELSDADDPRSCCSPTAVRRAGVVAGILGVPHDVVDARGAFASAVVEGFVASYLSGETPNPCVDCNPWRFGRLGALADAARAARVATGHYARVVRRGGRAFVARGVDAGKDQSYMLWRVGGALLDRVELPLGEMTKGEVRSLAEGAGLPVVAVPESQEVCFAPDGYRRFLASRGNVDCDGEIVDQAGMVLGRHRGAWRYTVGQRRGLGIPAEGPLYVLSVHAASGRVTVGPRESLAVTGVELREVVDYDLRDGEGLTVQLRYRSDATGVGRLRRPAAGRALVDLAEPFFGVAAGQSAVFYRDDVVVGGGVVATRRRQGLEATECDSLSPRSDSV